MFGLSIVAVNRKNPSQADVDFAIRHALAYEAKAVMVRTLTEYMQCALAVEYWQGIALELEQKLH